MQRPRIRSMVARPAPPMRRRLPPGHRVATVRAQNSRLIPMVGRRGIVVLREMATVCVVPGAG